MTQVQPSSRPRPRTLPPGAATPADHTTTDDIDAMLDEIDTVLEEAAVATRYRQRGGQ